MTARLLRLPRSLMSPDTVGRAVSPALGAPDARPRFLSEADCHDIGARLARIAHGGGETIATIHSTWKGNVRWARNQINTSGEDRNDDVQIKRVMPGSQNVLVGLNETTDVALTTAVRRAEQLIRSGPGTPDDAGLLHYVPESVSAPMLFGDATYQLDAGRRADAAHHLVQAATAAGMLSAGYLEVSAHSIAQITSWGYARYFQYTWAQCSTTVRDPQGTGSGWAGVDWPDWTQIDAPAMSALALDKCLRSRHPMAIEPGRYTTILEPQAVCDFVGQLMFGHWDPRPAYQALDRDYNEQVRGFPFNARSGGEGRSRLGERVVDERITISADPMDPELGFPPFNPWSGSWSDGRLDQDVFHPTTWIEHGVLTTLAYSRPYAEHHLGQHTGRPLDGAFRMRVDGPPTSLAEMIATTPRGLLVTRFDLIDPVDLTSLSLRGYTRDGLWLIEHGQISQPVKNMRWTESILFALNSLEQWGVPQRVFHPISSDWWAIPQPVIVPPLKIRDFQFTAISGAV